MPYTKKFKKDRRYLLNAINFPTPYQQCKDAGYRAFSTKNNRKQMDTVCSKFPVSGHINIEGKTDSSIHSDTVARCGEYRLGSYRNKCEQQVMNIIKDDMIRYRDAAETAAAQLIEDQRLAEIAVQQAADQAAADIAAAEAEAASAAAIALMEAEAAAAAAAIAAETARTQAEADAAAAAAAAAAAQANDALANSGNSTITTGSSTGATQAGMFGGNTGTLIGVAAAVGAVGWLVFSARNKKKKRKK